MRSLFISSLQHRYSSFLFPDPQLNLLLCFPRKKNAKKKHTHALSHHSRFENSALSHERHRCVSGDPAALPWRRNRRENDVLFIWSVFLEELALLHNERGGDDGLLEGGRTVVPFRADPAHRETPQKD
jgi:hypothetical protein